MILPLCALTFAVWALLPLVSSGTPTNRQKLEEVQRQIEITQGKIGRRKGTERVLSSDIARWTARIRRLQGRIGTLQRRQAVVQSSLDSAQGELDRTQEDRKSTRLNSSHIQKSRMPSSA